MRSCPRPSRQGQDGVTCRDRNSGDAAGRGAVRRAGRRASGKSAALCGPQSRGDSRTPGGSEGAQFSARISTGRECLNGRALSRQRARRPANLARTISIRRSLAPDLLRAPARLQSEVPAGRPARTMGFYLPTFSISTTGAGAGNIPGDNRGSFSPAA